MATAKGGYYTKDGTRVPSVTTVLGRFKESGGLIHWAWKLGTEGKDYRKVRDNAANSGTMAHEAVEAYIHGVPYEWAGEDEIVSKAKRAFGAFLEWADQTQLKVSHTEIPLVSEKYGFGGTFDAILIRNGRAMGDWKTSNSCYGEYLIQVAAYGMLWEENYPDDPITAGYHLLRFDKEYGDFHHHWWGELDKAKEAFIHLLELNKIDKELKARAA